LAGFFITVEGPDGTGKSTQVKLLGQYLKERGHEVLLTREPGGTSLAEKIRSILLDPGSAGIAPETEALLYAAARAQHVAEVIAPALASGKIVLSDRFIDSTIVYQGIGRGLAAGDIAAINSFATGGIKPDLTIVLDLEPEEGLARLASRCNGQEGFDRMEQESVEFYRKVREGYLALARQEERIKVISAKGTVEKVQERIIEILKQTGL
jgi:dTMP kinase